MYTLSTLVMIYDTVIIGAGAMGSATAYWLSKYQDNVLLLDQFELLHHEGSSHGMSRIIRRTYDQNHFANMMDEAYQLWNDVQTESEKTVYRQTGGLNIGPQDNNNLQETLRVCQDKGFDHQILNADQIRNRYPAYRVDDDYLGIYQEETGILNASASVELFQTLASRQGATIIGNRPVTKIMSKPDQVIISSGNNSYQAKNVVISSGVWMNQLLSQFEIELKVEIWKITIAYWKTLKPEWFSSEKFPVFIHWDDEINYGFPIHERQNYVKIAPHITKTIPKLASYDGQNEFNEELLNELKLFVSQRFEGLDAIPSYAETCLYTMTGDENFVIDYLPNNSNIVVAGGFSGHGFKFTPLIGKIVSELIMNKEPEYNMTHFKLANILQ